MKPCAATMTVILLLLCSCTATQRVEAAAGDRGSIQMPAGVAVPGLGSVF